MTKEDHKRGRVVEIRLKKSIYFNSQQIFRAIIEVDHINHGLNKDGKIKRTKRTHFTIKDIEKFIMLLDQETIMPRNYRGTKSEFEIRINCPVEGIFFQRQFIMIFDHDYLNPEIIHTITIYPGW